MNGKYVIKRFQSDPVFLASKGRRTDWVSKKTSPVTQKKTRTFVIL